MKKFIKTDLFVVFLIIFIFLLILPFFFLHQGLITIDTGREFYLAQQTLHGGVLYKDIFNIYGPFSYQFNALLFMFFGESIKTLYIAGILNSILILITLYLVSREFFNKKYSLLISILTMFSLVFTTFLFNSNITYSYGLVYALSSFLLSLLFLVKYLKAGKSNFAYLACLFAGISILNKYEFILYPFVIIYVLGFLKPIGKINILKAVFCFIAFPLISFLILFAQGLTFSDYIQACKMMGVMAKSDSMRFFYSVHGCFFDLKQYIRLVSQNPLYTVIGLLPIINIVLFLLKIRKIYKDKIKFVCCIALILAVFKFTLFLEINHMGAFFFPLCILTLLLLEERMSDMVKIFMLCILILFFAYSDFDSLKLKTQVLETPKGSIVTYIKDKLMMQTPIDYLIENSKSDETVLVVPEGAFVNFAADRKSDNMYHNLVPLYYTDTFGEGNVLSHFKEKPVDYVVILPLPTTEYASPDFCSYAGRFCEMINNGYNLVKEENDIRIYKRK